MTDDEVQDDEVLDDEALDDEALDDEFPSDAGAARPGFFTGLLFGVLIGAGIALVVTPDNGQVMRQRLRRRWRRLADDTRTQVGDWGEEARRQIRRQRRRLRKKLER